MKVHFRRLIPALCMTPLSIIFIVQSISKGDWIFAVINFVALIALFLLGYFTQKACETKYE